MAVIESVEHDTCAQCRAPVYHWVKRSLGGTVLTRRIEHSPATGSSSKGCADAPVEFAPRPV